MFDPKTKILVIDDMMTMRKMVSKTLKEMGFSDITEAADGTLGWEAIQGAKPPFGLIISDWNMPNCTGLELLKRVRGDSRYQATPFILVTAEAEMQQIMEAVKAGVSSYVVKPFTAESMREKIEAVHRKLAG